MLRREFIQKAGVAGVAATVLPSALAQEWLRARPGVQRILVVLSGGVRRSDFAAAWKKIAGGMHSCHVNMEALLPASVTTHAGAHEQLLTSFAPGRQSLLISEASLFMGRLHPHCALHQDIRSNWAEQVSTLQSKQETASAVVCIQGFDRAHYDVKGYLELLHQSLENFAELHHRLSREQKPCSLLLTTDMGRNAYYNTHGGLDHHDASAREIFQVEAALYPTVI